MGVLDLIILILVIAWIGGFSFKIAGGLIHILLVIALIVLIFRLLTGQGAA
ncbi:lmo0937 family membrane protein [Candidatus Peregrinibacteria bacterium]|nr:lmo0937 family membrane protein [Candidatus Peregrinibacteria bacterium]